MQEPVRRVIESCLPPVLKGKTAEELNSSFLKTHGNDLSALLVGLRLKVSLDPSASGEATKTLIKLDPQQANCTIDTCKSVLEALVCGDLGPEGKAAAQKYKETCSQIFPMSQCFMDPEKIGNHVNDLAEDLDNAAINE